MLDWSEPTQPSAPTIRLKPESLSPEADATGLGEIDRRGGRVSVDDKRMINCRAVGSHLAVRIRNK